MLLSDKRLFSNDETKQILSTCMLVSTQKMKKTVPIVINDGEHTWRIEDGVFPCNCFPVMTKKLIKGFH